MRHLILCRLTFHIFDHELGRVSSSERGREAEVRTFKNYLSIRSGTSNVKFIKHDFTDVFIFQNFPLSFCQGFSSSLYYSIYLYVT